MSRILLVLFVCASLNSFAFLSGKGDFENTTFFNIGYSFPSKSRLNVYNPSNVQTLSGEIELGGIWHIRLLPITKYARLGFAGDFLNLGCNYFTFDEAGKSDKSKIITGRFSVNVGPNLSIQCFQDGYTDIYLKGRATVVYDNVKTSMMDDDGLGFGFKYSFGMNFRWKALYFGAEAIYGTIKKVDYSNANQTFAVPDDYIKIKLGVNLD